MRKATVVLLTGLAALLGQTPNNDLGYTDTPMLPGLPYRVHDPARPHPAVVTPAAQPGGAPSDAIVLFDGKDLSHWTSAKLDPVRPVAGPEPAGWKVENGYMEVAGRGDIATQEKFGDIQLHVEWAAPAEVRGNSQGRGNSGIFLQGRYEVQVLDAFQNPTYADGQAGAIYGQWPPLVNPARKPGEWQSYDIVFEAPRFAGEQLFEARVSHGVPQRSAVAQSQGSHGPDGAPCAGEIRPAAVRGFADPAKPRQSGAIPQYLGSAFGRVRSAGVGRPDSPTFEGRKETSSSSVMPAAGPYLFIGRGARLKVWLSKRRFLCASIWLRCCV